MLSVHTSPLEQPGSGDAGGMNVYIDAVARRMARRGVEVEVFTRATSSEQPLRTVVEPGYAVRHVLAGPFGGVAKEDLPGLLCPFAANVLRAATPLGPQSRFDVVHSHYWLSGQVGAVVRDRWGIPLVHTAHTLAKVKNAALAGDDDRREPRLRELGEELVVAEADVLVAATDAEVRQLATMYDAPRDRLAVVPPGVDIDLFCPGGVGGGASGAAAASGAAGLPAPRDLFSAAVPLGAAHRARRLAARAALGIAPDEVALAFVGRIQPHKGPEVLVRALAELHDRHPGRPITALIVGDSSGSGHAEPARLRSLAAALGVADAVRLLPAMPPELLAGLYCAADVIAVPSHSESFGLVALEAQACGTPVVAAAVGGLPVAVADGVSGLLVEGYATGDWADALQSIALHPARRERMSVAARAHAESFSWDITVDRLLDVYARAAAPTLVGLEAGA